MRTDIKMRFNLGYLHGNEERRFQLTDRVTDFEGLWNHLSDLMPDPADFGQSISGITLHALSTDPMWFCTGNEDPMTYGMQIGFAIHHEGPLSLAAARPIIDAVYENGANASYTPDSDDTYPYTFMYPYHIIHDIGGAGDLGEAGASEAGDLGEADISGAPAPEEDADVYTPCPPRRNPQYNCSPAFATCDGEYPPHHQVVDMHYTCERCGRTISHSIDNPTVCKRCF